MKEEKNKKQVGVWIAIVIIAAILGFAVYYFGLRDNKSEEEPKTSYTEDELKFEEEYESINGRIREATGVENKTIDIPKDNNVVYLSDEETVKFLENGTGIIYMGFKECPWCRNAVPVLLQAAKNAGIEKVYYLDVTNIKSTIVINAKGKAEITKKGTDAYYKIMELLDDYLKIYTMKDSKGKDVKTGEKRILSPTVITVKDGVVTGFHVGTLDEHKKDENGVLPDLTEEQEEQVNNIYAEMISTISDSACDDGCD